MDSFENGFEADTGFKLVLKGEYCSMQPALSLFSRKERSTISTNSVIVVWRKMPKSERMLFIRTAPAFLKQVTTCFLSPGFLLIAGSPGDPTRNVVFSHIPLVFSLAEA